MCPICIATSTRPCFPQSCSSWARCELGAAIAGPGRGAEFVSGASTVPHSTPLSFIPPTVHFSFKKGDTICSWPKGPKMHHRFPLTRWSSDASLSSRSKASRTDQWTTRTDWATPSIPVNIMMEFPDFLSWEGCYKPRKPAHRWTVVESCWESIFLPPMNSPGTGMEIRHWAPPSIIHVMFKYQEQTFLFRARFTPLKRYEWFIYFLFFAIHSNWGFKVSYKKPLMKVKCSSMNITETLFSIRN